MSTRQLWIEVYRRMLKTPYLFALIILAAIFPFALLVSNKFGLTQETQNIIRWISTGSVILVTSLIALRSFLFYLEPEKSKSARYDYRDAELEFHQLNQRIKSLQEEIRQIGTINIEAKDINKAELLEALKSSIEQRLSEGTLKAIDEEFAKRDLQNKQWERLIVGFEDIRKRLYEETDNLARRSNLNLALGSLTTVVAGIGLVVVVFLKPLDLTGLTKEEYAWKIIAHYIPRLSLIIFAEVFAYFFLRLYKAGLSDMKFYQNELTNVEIKLTALKAALVTQDKEIIKLVIGELSKTERNFILKKGETTVELEKFKSDGINVKDLLEHFPTIAKGK